jgi:hypothetical protein
MIEQLEAEAVRLLGCGLGAVAVAAAQHDGNSVEVGARHLSHGRTVFSYRYGGVRLERTVLLLLLCTEVDCERSLAVKRQWLTANPPPLGLQRRTKSGLRRMPSFEAVPLFREVDLEGSKGEACVARPATFVCLTACPVKAHGPAVLCKSGWDVFQNGKYIAGGLRQSSGTGRQPRFPSLESVEAWLKGPTHACRQSGTSVSPDVMGWAAVSKPNTASATKEDPGKPKCLL